MIHCLSYFVATGCGENLFMSSNPRSWSDAIQSLYDEVKDFKYGFGSTRPNAVTGHYTQVKMKWQSCNVSCPLPSQNYSLSSVYSGDAKHKP